MTAAIAFLTRAKGYARLRRLGLLAGPRRLSARETCAMQAASIGVRHQQLSPAIAPGLSVGLIVAPGRTPEILGVRQPGKPQVKDGFGWVLDRKSTRLNSS